MKRSTKIAIMCVGGPLAVILVHKSPLPLVPVTALGSSALLTLACRGTMETDEP